MLCSLKKMEEVHSARKLLTGRGLNVLPTRLEMLLRSLRFVKSIAVGDETKGWDVLKTVDFITDRLDKDAAILDLGAFSSEILPLLLRLEFKNLTGIDLNPRISEMPASAVIRYDVGDFLASRYSAGSFSAITAISVIEHGYDGKRLFREIARLLTQGGYFVASFDYWPDKTESVDLRPFGLSWTIFSQDEVMEMVALAASFGLQPVGELDFSGEDKTIKWEGREYTFAWLALQKLGQ